MRGRKKKPTKLAVLEGTFRKDRNPGSEMQPTSKIPPCPKHLNAIGRKEWKRMVDELEALDILTGLDMALLGGYCDQYSRWVEACKIVNKEGITVVVVGSMGQTKTIAHPALMIADKALTQMKSFAIEFGFSPSARSRIRFKVPEKDDKFGDWMNGTENK